MAINRTAKNLNVKIKNNYICLTKGINESSEKIEIVATNENLTLISNKKINIRGNKS